MSRASEPLYRSIADRLRRRILAGELTEGSQVSPEIRLAKELGVSRGTVRQALDMLVREGLLERTPAKGTFVRPLPRPETTRIIGIIVPYLRDTLISEMLRGTESTLHKNGYSLVLGHSDNDMGLEQEQVRKVVANRIEGLILFPIARSEEYSLLRSLFPRQLPLVLIDRRLPGLDSDLVLSDHTGGAYQAVTYLLGLGHNRIACIRTPDRPSSVEERVRGYERAMMDHGSHPLAATALAGYGRPSSSVPSYSPEEMAPVLALFDLEEPPTALFCVNDFIALGVIEHLGRRGLRVPEDVSVVGFDDIAPAAMGARPLTTVAQPKYEIGTAAAEQLLTRIRGATRPSTVVRLPVSLVIRSTTALRTEAPTSGG